MDAAEGHLVKANTLPACSLSVSSS